MMRGLTQEQKDLLDNEMTAYRKRTGNHLNSISKLDSVKYDLVVNMNVFETIYQEVNMYLWDNTQKSTPKGARLYSGLTVVEE
jgi:hypothetical protein